MNQHLCDILSFLWADYPLQHLAVAVRIPVTGVVVHLCWGEPAKASANLIASRKLQWLGRRIGVIDVQSRSYGSLAELLAALDEAEAAIENYLAATAGDSGSAAA